MADTMSNPTVLQGVTSIAGTALTAAGQQQQGVASTTVASRKAALADFQAQQLETNALTAQASAQRQALEEQRNAAIVSSRALAVAASSGGGASDPTVINMMARIAAEGQYRATVSLYNGETQANQQRAQAAAKRYEGATAIADGNTAQSASNFSAFGTVLKGAGSMFSKYNAGNTANTSFGGGTDNFSAYTSDASGAQYSATGADVAARR